MSAKETVKVEPFTFETAVAYLTETAPHAEALNAKVTALTATAMARESSAKDRMAAMKELIAVEAESDALNARRAEAEAAVKAEVSAKLAKMAEDEGSARTAFAVARDKAVASDADEDRKAAHAALDTAMNANIRLRAARKAAGMDEPKRHGNGNGNGERTTELKANINADGASVQFVGKDKAAIFDSALEGIGGITGIGKDVQWGNKESFGARFYTIPTTAFGAARDAVKAIEDNAGDNKGLARAARTMAKRLTLIETGEGGVVTRFGDSAEKPLTFAEGKWA